MGFKSRGNFAVGTCFDSCQCLQCRKDKTPRNYKSGDKKANSLGIVVSTNYAPDGSKLDKPMSQTYIDHITSRNSESIKRMKPNMGAYGA
jgi:hypothetical protein